MNGQRPLGVVVAMLVEAQALGCAGPPVTARAVEARPGLRVRLCGVGADRARVAARALAAEGARGLVSFGAAAGLDPGLAPGDLVLPAEVLAASGTRFATDAGWRDEIRAALGDALRVEGGAIAETRTVLADGAAKAALARTGAVAADMESAAVGEVAAAEGLPFVVLRIVSDGSNAPLPRCVLTGTDDFGRVRPLALIAGLARRPHELVPLLALARAYPRLRRGLRLAGSALPGRCP